VILIKVVLVGNGRLRVRALEEILKAMLHPGRLKYVVLNVLVIVFAAGQLDDAAKEQIGHAAILKGGSGFEVWRFPIEDREIGLQILKAPHVRTVLTCIVITQARGM
jgi:hypothetical protein